MPEMDLLIQAGGVGLAILALWLNHVERKENQTKYFDEQKANRVERKENQELIRKQIELTDVRIARVENGLKDVDDNVKDLKQVILNHKEAQK